MIKKWNQFNEAISGTTDMSRFGPNDAIQELPTTLPTKQILSDKSGNFYTQDDFDTLYNEILKSHKNEFVKNGVNLISLKQFTKQNLDFLIEFIE